MGKKFSKFTAILLASTGVAFGSLRAQTTTLNYKISRRALPRFKQAECEKTLISIIEDDLMNPAGRVYIYHSQEREFTLRRLGLDENQVTKVLDYLDQTFSLYQDDPAVQEFKLGYDQEDVGVFYCVMSPECGGFKSRDELGVYAAVVGKEWHPSFIIFPNITDILKNPHLQSLSEKARLILIAHNLVHESQHHLDRIRYQNWIRANYRRWTMHLPFDPLFAACVKTKIVFKNGKPALLIYPDREFRTIFSEGRAVYMDSLVDSAVEGTRRINREWDYFHMLTRPPYNVNINTTLVRFGISANNWFQLTQAWSKQMDRTILETNAEFSRRRK